jgi:hypothetical protein
MTSARTRGVVFAGALLLTLAGNATAIQLDVWSGHLDTTHQVIKIYRPVGTDDVQVAWHYKCAQDVGGYSTLTTSINGSVKGGRFHAKGKANDGIGTATVTGKLGTHATGHVKVNVEYTGSKCRAKDTFDVPQTRDN